MPAVFTPGMDILKPFIDDTYCVSDTVGRHYENEGLKCIN